jgi:hypothetical protein
LFVFSLLAGTQCIDPSAHERGGRDVVARSFILLLIVVVSALASAQVLGQESGGPKPDLANAFGGSALTCPRPPTLEMPRPALERAKLKVRLINLLRDSLYDDAKGIVNIAREREIKKLANELKSKKHD